MHELQIERRAEKDIDSLPREVAERAIRAIGTLRGNPRPHGSVKLAGSANDWRIRIGDYRVLYEIHDDRQLVRVMRVKHRRDAYR